MSDKVCPEDKPRVLSPELNKTFSKWQVPPPLLLSGEVSSEPKTLVLYSLTPAPAMQYFILLDPPFNLDVLVRDLSGSSSLDFGIEEKERGYFILSGLQK